MILWRIAGYVIALILRVRSLFPLLVLAACVDPGGITTVTPTSWCVTSFVWRYDANDFQERSIGASVNTFTLTLRGGTAEGAGYYTARLEQVENGDVDTVNVTVLWPFAAPYTIQGARILIDADDSILGHPLVVTTFTETGAKSSLAASTEQLRITWGACAS